MTDSFTLTELTGDCRDDEDTDEGEEDEEDKDEIALPAQGIWPRIE